MVHKDMAPLGGVPMSQRARRAVVLVFLLAWVSTDAFADSGWRDNDAGTGADAGNSRAAATPVNLAIKYGGGASGSDIDWYATSVPASGASCVETRVHAENPMYFALGAEVADSTVSAPIRVNASEEGVAGIAGQTPLTATLRARRVPYTDSQTNYDFRLDRIGIPSGNLDGPTGVDAGDSASTAMPISFGCTGGHLAMLDLRDVFALQLPAGRVLTYSLAANSGGFSLALLDSIGNAVGPALDPGQVATASPPSGTYYLSAQRSAGVTDVGYVIGALAGPEPTGCRPLCID